MGMGAATLLRFTMRPLFWARMMGITARFRFTMPKKLASKSRLASDVGVNSMAPEMPKPALFTSTSIRPSRSITWEMAAFTISSLVMSVGIWCRPSTPSGRRLSS